MDAEGEVRFTWYVHEIYFNSEVTEKHHIYKNINYFKVYIGISSYIKFKLLLQIMDFLALKNEVKPTKTI